MADDLPDFPIVVLENDFPELPGRVGLFDFIMTVGATGIQFTAAIPGVLRVTTIEFTPLAQLYARRRAASTLAQWGLTNGDTLQFLRLAVPRTEQEQADKFGVPLVSLQAWEANTAEIPILSWRELATEVARLDGRFLPQNGQCPTSFRGRRIRVFPNIPWKSTAPPGGRGNGNGMVGCPPVPPVC